MLKGDKYKLHLPGQDILSDGKYQWTYMKDAKETQKNYAEKNAEGLTPTNIFTMYEKGFKYKFDKEEKGIQTINLYPTKPDGKKYHTIKLMIDKAKKQITSVKVLNKDGTTQTITINAFTPNTEMKDTVFQWDNKTYPGEIVDLTDDGSSER
jgi:outer membrane lipoprotein-sorting protein